MEPLPRARTPSVLKLEAVLDLEVIPEGFYGADHGATEHRLVHRNPPILQRGHADHGEDRFNSGGHAFPDRDSPQELHAAPYFFAAPVNPRAVRYGITVNSTIRHSQPMITAAAAGLNIGLNLWLVPHYGILAAAWTTVAGYALMARRLLEHEFFKNPQTSETPASVPR